MDMRTYGYGAQEVAGICASPTAPIAASLLYKTGAAVCSAAGPTHSCAAVHWGLIKADSVMTQDGSNDISCGDSASNPFWPFGFLTFAQETSIFPTVGDSTEWVGPTTFIVCCT